MNKQHLRNRIVGHRVVPASSLKAHPLNWRTHPAGQRSALGASIDEVGFARSLLVYEDPEWGLTVIDGHLRRDELGDLPVTVEVLEVSRDEARKLLLSLDSLSALAGVDDDAVRALLDSTEADNQELRALWDGLVGDEPIVPEEEDDETGVEQFLVLITCKSEKHQADVIEACVAKGWKCKALNS